MTRVKQSSLDLQNHLQEQLQFLVASSNSYDEGFHDEAKRMSVVLRTLLHDYGQSKSLFGQLGIKNKKFYDTIANFNRSKDECLGSFHGIIGVGINDKDYVPFLDEPVPGSAGYVDFNDFWERIILIDNKNSFSRKDIVYSVANQDGGAHIDPSLDEKYYLLSRENSLGLKVGSDNLLPISLGNPALASLRQITHEVLRTMLPEYPFKKIKTSGVMIGDVTITKTENNSWPSKKNKIGRNDPCPCGLKKADGNPKKYKKCCGI